MDATGYVFGAWEGYFSALHVSVGLNGRISVKISEAPTDGYAKFWYWCAQDDWDCA